MELHFAGWIPLRGPLLVQDEPDALFLLSQAVIGRIEHAVSIEIFVIDGLGPFKVVALEVQVYVLNALFKCFLLFLRKQVAVEDLFPSGSFLFVLCEHHRDDLFHVIRYHGGLGEFVFSLLDLVDQLIN